MRKLCKPRMLMTTGPSAGHRFRSVGEMLLSVYLILMDFGLKCGFNLRR